MLFLKPQFVGSTAGRKDRSRPDTGIGKGMDVVLISKIYFLMCNKVCGMCCQSNIHE